MGTNETMNGECRPSASRRAEEQTLFSALVALARYVEGCMRKRRSRLDLLELTDEQLCDIGVKRSEAQREGSRPFWD